MRKVKTISDTWQEQRRFYIQGCLCESEEVPPFLREGTKKQFLREVTKKITALRLNSGPLAPLHRFMTPEVKIRKDLTFFTKN